MSSHLKNIEGMTMEGKLPEVLCDKILNWWKEYEKTI